MKLENKYDSNIKEKHYLNTRQKQIIEILRIGQPLKVSDIFRNLGSSSINTVKKDLQYLISEKLIEKIGKGRGTVYLKIE